MTSHATALPTDLRRLLTLQDGVVSRRQALSAGLADHDVERMLRRRLWARAASGVYVVHTGPLADGQRLWAAVLSCWPAALYGPSALAGHGLRAVGSGPVHVAVDHSRRVVGADGVALHRVVDLDRRVAWHLAPPRLRLEDAVLSACALAPSRSAALALAADACQQRRTTAARLLEALALRGPMRHGRWLRTVLGDVEQGALSVLERAYLSRVERRHRLPVGVRQVRDVSAVGTAYRDVTYLDQRVVVELDGRVGHEWSADRWSDMDRDLLAGGQDLLTLRLGWRHVDDRPCRTAAEVGQVLRARGWRGAPSPCGPSCDVSGRISGAG